MAARTITVFTTLNDVPDASLEPEVWSEMNKVFQAIKTATEAMDSGVHPGLVGTPGSAVKAQVYSVMYRTPQIAITAGTVCMFDNGVPRPCSATYPFADGISEVNILANTAGPFIMFGMVYYVPGGLVIGSRYYINTAVAGAITTATGGRYVGQAFSASSLFFDPQSF